MVYVSSNSISFGSRQAVLKIQNSLSELQTEQASGVHADVGTTLGARSSQLIDLQQFQSSVQTTLSNNTLATTRLATSVTVLDTLRKTANSFLANLTTASSGGGLTTSLQTTAQTSLSGLTSALNTSITGQFLFGGINSGVKPLTDYVQSPASANKTAVDNAFSTQFGFSQTASNVNTISASAMQSFLNTSFGSMFSASGFGTSWSAASNTAITSEISAGQTADTSVSANASPFRQLAQAYTMVSEFGGTNFDSGANQAVVASALSLVTSALAGLTSVEAGVGITQTAISDANTSLQAQSDVIATQTDALAGVEQLDIPTRLASLTTQLNASYSLTAQIQKLSLLSYLS